MSFLKRSLLSIALASALSASAQPCLIDYLFTANVQPVNGTYACGQTVTFCFTLNSWNTTNANWFQGVVASFGAGWDMATLVPGAPPPECGVSGGTWGWYNSVQGTAGTAIGPQGPGFFFDLNNDGNPGNNFGDFCTGPWTFCWTISVLSGVDCVNGLDLGVSVNTFGDSETGSWGSSGCTGDAVIPSTPAVIQNCAANAGIGGPLALCNTSPTASPFATLGGTPDAGGTWTNPSGAPQSGTFDPAVDPSGNYTYTVGTIVPPCSSSSVIAVSVALQPNAGTDGTLTLCASSPPANLFSSLGGSPGLSGTWNGPAGISSGILDPAVSLQGAYIYTVTGTPPCANASATVTVNINPSPNAGSPGALTVCSNGVPEALFNFLSGAPSAGGVWSGPGGAMGGTYDPAINTPGVFTYSIAGVAPCANSSATVTVTENVAPDAGSDAAAIMCNSVGLTTLTTLLNGTPALGGIWTDPNGAVVTDVFDLNLGFTGPYTYTIAGAAPCVNAQAVLDLSIFTQPLAGSNGALNLCEASAPTDLFTALGGTPDPGGSWTNASGSPVPALFDPLTGNSGTYTYTVPAVAPCVNATADVVVNLSAQPSAGVDALLDVCSNDPNVALFTLLGATAQLGGTWMDPNGLANTGTFDPGASADGVYTYTIIGVAPCNSSSASITIATVQAGFAGVGSALTSCDNGVAMLLDGWLTGGPDAGGTWTYPSGAVSNGTLDPSTDPDGNYTYTIPASGPCPAVTAVVPVTINAAPDAGDNGAVDLCTDLAAPYALINGLGGSPAANGTWTAPDGTAQGSTFNVASDAAGVYTYTVNAILPCLPASSTVTIGLVQAMNAGTGGSASLCENAGPADPSVWLAGSADAGGTWTSPSGAVIANVDPSSAQSGVYTYTVNGTAPCPDDQATVDITIDLLPNAGTANSVDLCADASAENLLLLLAGAQAGGNWTGPSGIAAGFFQPGANLPGTYTYTVYGVGACANENDNSTVDVNVLPLPIPSFSIDLAAGCAPLQVQFTNNDPAGAQSANWSFGDGATDNALATAMHAYDEGGSYSVSLEVTDANGCTGEITLTDTITVSEGPDAMFYALPLRVSVNTPTTQVSHIADDGINYIWAIDSATVDTSGNFAWTFHPATIGEHPICLTATDTLGCESTYCIKVVVDDDLTIYVPNAFTPNGDDDNDVFRPSIIGVQQDWYEFMVFDRWGLLVFRTSDPNEAWNGGMANDGEVLPDGVYVWTLKAKDQFTPEKAELIGHVTLVK